MQVVDHFEKPRNVGSFDKNDPNVGTGLVGAPACGDVMKLQIKVRSTSHGHSHTIFNIYFIINFTSLVSLFAGGR